MPVLTFDPPLNTTTYSYIGSNIFLEQRKILTPPQSGRPNTRSFDLEEEEVLIPGLVEVFFLCSNGETRLLRILGQQSLQ